MNIRNKLKSIHLKLTELSSYLNISRPTLYKHILNFDNKEYEKIPQKFLHIFNYIIREDILFKENIISYIVNHKKQDINSDMSIKENTVFLDEELVNLLKQLNVCQMEKVKDYILLLLK